MTKLEYDLQRARAKIEELETQLITVREQKIDLIAENIELRRTIARLLDGKENDF